MFANVTYNFYSNNLGRAVIPDEATFNKYKLVNVQKMKKVMPYLIELEENGIDSAVCMMIEVDYTEEAERKGDSAVISSESVTGHSVSFETSAIAESARLNAKSTEEKKMDMIHLFCSVDAGAARR